MADAMSAPPPFTPASLGAPSTHARALVRSTIGGHPVAAAWLIGGLVVAVLVLGYYVMKYRPKKASTFVTAVNNMTHGGANPLWHLGGADAGNGGSLARATTNVHAAVFDPSLRGHHRRACGPWSAGAVTEAQALGSVGSYAHDDFGASRFQRVVNSAADSPNGVGGMPAGSMAVPSPPPALDDLTLSDVMHQGGSP